MVRPVMVAGRRIGPGEPCFVIAEAGVNHNGDLKLASRLVDAAAHPHPGHFPAYRRLAPEAVET